MHSAAIAHERPTGSTIVVVDDDDDGRDAVREALHGAGYITLGASNGREALDILHVSPEHPRLILLDLVMPTMDGWQFLLEVDDDPDLQEIPVALMSAHPSIRNAFDSGPKYGFTRLLLPKPLDLARLLSFVRSVCAAPRTCAAPS
jgi:CheY-like chemotaxis protein